MSDEFDPRHNPAFRPNWGERPEPTSTPAPGFGQPPSPWQPFRSPDRASGPDAPGPDQWFGGAPSAWPPFDPSFRPPPPVPGPGPARSGGRSWGTPLLLALVAILTISTAGLLIARSGDDGAGSERQLVSSVQFSTPAALTESGGSNQVVDVVARVAPAVVTVINRQESQAIGDDTSVEVGAGTGFFIDLDGYIVTNQHVVAGGTDFLIVLADGSTRAGDLVGADPVSDLAVLRVDGEVPAYVAFGDSDRLQPGAGVLAIGSPLGAFSNTVTEGIVSAIGRTDAQFQGSGGLYANLVQHDAAINPGNSGGPLFTLDGSVVGVNTLGIPQDADGTPVQGLFFAIPSNSVAQVVNTLIAEGEVVYPYLGIQSVAISPTLAAQYGLPVSYGELVLDDPAAGSPAADAGLRAGDILVSLDGEPIDLQTPFLELLFAHEPDDTVDFVVQRGDDQIELEITLQTRPDQ